MQMHVATVAGRLRVSVRGDGPITVFWHSLFTDSTSWAGVVRHLTDRTIVLVDGPGHGESTPVTAHDSVSVCADAAAHIIATVSAESPVDWVGNAWGGQVGLALATEHPRRVHSLAVIGTPFDRVRGNTRVRLHLAATILSIRPAALSRLAPPIARGLLAPSADPALVERTTRGIAAMRPADVARSIRRFSLARGDERGALDALTVPTVVMVPEFGVAAGEATAAPSVRTVRLNGTSTLAPREDPDAVSAALRTFWSELPA